MKHFTQFPTNKLNNSFGLSINLSEPYACFATRGGGGPTQAPGFPSQSAHPFWGALNVDRCARLSGYAGSYSTYKPPGYGRWLASTIAPYRGGKVVGFKVNVRAEQATHTPNAPDAQGNQTPPEDLVRSIAVCTKLAKEDWDFATDTRGSSQLIAWQGKRRMKQQNMTTAIANYSSSYEGPVAGNAHQCYFTVKGSPADMYSITDIKDVNELGFIHGGQDIGQPVTGNVSSDIVRPTDKCYLHIGCFDRFSQIDNTTSGTAQPNILPHKMPHMVIRTKITMAVLCTEPNNNINVDGL